MGFLVFQVHDRVGFFFDIVSLIYGFKPPIDLTAGEIQWKAGVGRQRNTKVQEARERST